MEGLTGATWRMLARESRDRELPRGLDALWDKAVGFVVGLAPGCGGFLRQADRIVDLEKRLLHASDHSLRDKAAQMHERFRLNRDTVEDRHLAFALVREVAARKIGLRPFPVQVAGALAIDAGCITEMATGEGKTLVATMPAVIAGWRGRGCHVVTANDYLARRDAESMKAVYKFCGLEVGCIQQGMAPVERKRAYHAHVTYCTSKEVAADFLRDRLILGRLQGLPSALVAKMAGNIGMGMDRLVQRGLDCAIVDEADSVLIDEAATPLILSGEAHNQEHMEAHAQAARAASELDASSDYCIDNRYREVNLTPVGKHRLAELTESFGGLWACTRRREELVVQALVAREFFVRDKQYIIDDQQIVIVDEFTGRLMPDRTWRNGLHQAVEAKEGVKINLPRETRARISFQRFFRLYRKLSGMTGTGAEARAEFWQIYHLPVVVIPTNRPCVRIIKPTRVFTSAEEKWGAVTEEVRRVNETGCPILIGTRSVFASERFSRILQAEGLEHQVLNAVHQDREAHIIAGAGLQGCITVATNMAGRGTDIRLGAHVADLGGLHVIATERHEAGRIDRQLYGRCARQGDPGSARAFVSLEDELMRQHAPLKAAALARRYGRNEREISSAFSRELVNSTQRRAERVALRHRKNVLRMDRWLQEHLGFTGKGF